MSPNVRARRAARHAHLAARSLHVAFSTPGGATSASAASWMRLQRVESPPRYPWQQRLVRIALPCKSGRWSGAATVCLPRATTASHHNQRQRGSMNAAPTPQPSPPSTPSQAAAQQSMQESRQESRLRGEQPVGPRLAVELTDVSRSFGDVLGVDSVSLSVPEGAIVGVIGPSGAGKTTPSADHRRASTGQGSCPSPGRGPGSSGAHARAHRVHAPALRPVPDLTARENIDFMASLFGIRRGGRSPRGRVSTWSSYGMRVTVGRPLYRAAAAPAGAGLLPRHRPSL